MRLSSVVAAFCATFVASAFSLGANAGDNDPSPTVSHPEYPSTRDLHPSRWLSCGAGYSEHLPVKSDIGGDYKSALASCAWIAANGVRQTIELGALAQTPPDSRRNPVVIGGIPATVGGRPSDQFDTYQAFAGFGQEFDRSPTKAWLWQARVGVINGWSTGLVQGAVDDVHHEEGLSWSRHSPLTSGSCPLLQVAGAHTSALLTRPFDGWRLSFSDVESAVVGSATDAITIGGQIILQSDSADPVLPMGLPGMPLRTATGWGLHAGIDSQFTAYDLSMSRAGTTAAFPYANFGVGALLGKHLTAGVELTVPLAHQVRDQYVSSDTYYEANLGYRF
jgi:hypothetical protein